jgi:cell wall-associated NlpC family hydrolase
MAIGVGLALLAPSTAIAQSTGGTGTADASQEPAPAPEETTPTSSGCTVGGGGVGTSESCPTGKAQLTSTGIAVPPADAPWRVKRAIRWANKIVDKPYRLGGGHRLPWRMDTAYDCSGTVSWALRGGRMISAPLPSGDFRRWADPGRGRWITVYYNGGHAYATIAGLRLDTSMVPGNGPGWSTRMRSSAGYKSRHYPGL